MNTFCARFMLMTGLVLAALCTGSIGLDADADPIRVLSFNIRYGTAADGPNHWDLRRELVRRVIREERPGILALQEALDVQLAYILSSFRQYRKVGVHRHGGDRGEFCGLLIDRRRFEIRDSGEFWLSETPDVPGSKGWDANISRMCIWCRVRDRSSGRSFWIYATHFDHRGMHARREGASLILGKMAVHLEEHPEPVLLIGDLNEGNYGLGVKQLLESGLRDTYRVLHPEREGTGTFNGFKGSTSGAKIDYVLASSEWQVLEAEIVRTNEEERYPSDHYPVLAVCTLPREGDRSEPADPAPTGGE